MGLPLPGFQVLDLRCERAKNGYRRRAPLEKGRDGVVQCHIAASILARSWKNSRLAAFRPRILAVIFGLRTAARGQFCSAFMPGCTAFDAAESRTARSPVERECYE